MAISFSERARLTEHEFQVMAGELGDRVMQYLVIEKSCWAYKMWFMTGQWWWNEDTRSFIKETRPEMLRFSRIREDSRTRKEQPK